MAEYTTVAVDMEADAMFAWVADPMSLAAYVPAVREARAVGREEIVVLTDGGTACPAWLRVYRDSRQLAWGTDAGHYRGELHVVPRLAGRGCSVTVTVKADRLDEHVLALAVEACLASAADAARTTRLADPASPTLPGDPAR